MNYHFKTTFKTFLRVINIFGMVKNLKSLIGHYREFQIGKIKTNKRKEIYEYI